MSKSDTSMEADHNLEFKTGTLVSFRQRPWIVLKHPDPKMLLLKPLGGTDKENLGIYLPLYTDNSKMTSKDMFINANKTLGIQPYSFTPPQEIDLNNHFALAKTFYNACRLSFRDVAGPFQSLGRLSFEPRPYQMVPLILALKQEKVRLMISDDVGIGKTLESLIIAKELLDRREINRFAVICLPHLCEQWQNEIKDKFGLEAQIIRSSTITSLEKKLRADQNIFRDIPFQVISIDYIKQDARRNTFLDHCPEFIIVDEAHTCARPKGANTNQQLRHSLLQDIANKPDQQLILLTATPHSGHNEEFQSLIALLNPKFANYTLDSAKERAELSNYFIQRRRADVKPYLGEGETIFPERCTLSTSFFNHSAKSSKAKGNADILGQTQIIDDGDFDAAAFNHTPEYQQLLSSIIDYVRDGVSRVKDEDSRKRRYTYWDLLGLMRGIMSSPAAGISMIENKLAKKNDSGNDSSQEPQDIPIFKFNEQLKDLLNGDDVIPEAYEKANRHDITKFNEFKSILLNIKEQQGDNKVKKALEIVKIALNNGKNPIVFCQYIQTAKYVKDFISNALQNDKKLKKVKVEAITSRLADEERKLKIDLLAKEDQHVLVCTDCLSEGVNLQNGFDAVIHYDLPWNPNRLEQRNGRIDRFGQTSKEVLIVTLHSNSNPVDDIVLKVLYRKQREIKKKLGVYLPIAENDASLMESIMERVMEYNFQQTGARQVGLFETAPNILMDKDEEQNFMIELKRMEDYETRSRTYFAHNRDSMSPQGLAPALKEATNVIGGVEDTESFVIKVLQDVLNLEVSQDSPLCYSIHVAQLNNINNKELQNYFYGLNRGIQSVNTSSGKATKAQNITKGKNNNLLIRFSFASPTPKGYTYIGRNHEIVDYLSRKVINDTLNPKIEQDPNSGKSIIKHESCEFRTCRAAHILTHDVNIRTTVLMLRARSVIRDRDHHERELVGEEMIFMGYEGEIEDNNFLDPQRAKELFLNAQADKNSTDIQQRQDFQELLSWTNNECDVRKYTDQLALERAKKLVDSFAQYRKYEQSPEYQPVKPVLPMDIVAAYIYVPIPKLFVVDQSITMGLYLSLTF